MRKKNKTLKLAAKIAEAEEQLRTHLEHTFPLLTRVSFVWQFSQVNRSIGEVIGHPGSRHAYLRIRMDSRTQKVIDIPACDVHVISGGVES